MIQAKSALQALINTLSRGKALTLDGKIGPSSMEAIASLNPNDQQLVSVFGRTILDFYPPRGISFQKLDQMITDAAERKQIPASYLILMVKQENHTSVEGIVVEYEGTFKGIAQFNKQTWDAVSRLEYEDFVVDDYRSLIAASELYLRNRTSFRIKFPGAYYTDEIAYLYHNQGAGESARFLSTGHAEPALLSQSRAAQAVAYKALDQFNSYLDQLESQTA